MAVDKLVDSTQLDADLTSVANAIRTKGGTSAALAFPSGFVSAVEAIETGGGGANAQYISVLEGRSQSGILTLPDVTILRSRLFNSISGNYSVESTDLITISEYCFDASAGLVGLKVPNCTYIGSYALRGTHQTLLFAPQAVLASNCANANTYLQTAICGGTPTSGSLNYQFRNATALTTVDITGNARLDYTFNGCSLFTTLILRNPTIITLVNTGTFTNTPFASDGSGGTLYVPSALVSSYQSATNWSTILGYANNQILPIEGSIYETQYADGTPIT